MMKSTILHTNFNVLDLQKSLAFYEKAVGLTEKRRKTAADGSFIIVFLGDGESSCELELTWLADRKEPYDLGDEEFHLAVKMDDLGKARLISFMKKWAVSAMKIRRWGFILLRIRTAIGLKYYKAVYKLSVGTE